MAAIVPTEQKHLIDIARLYYDSFQPLFDSLFRTSKVAQELFHDWFKLVYDLHSLGFYSALSEDKLIGYIVIIDDFSRFPGKLLFQSSTWKMIYKWITGQYPGVGIHWCLPASKMAWNYFTYHQPHPIANPYSQVFSIAVSPEFRGKGIGKQLLENGILHWEQQPGKVLCLEVDGNNQAAIHLYQSFDFTTVGELKSPRGVVLIMLKFKH
jgi:ribosomal protein S18 acetylase RimI-like enzyme